MRAATIGDMRRTPALTVSALALTLAFGLTGCDVIASPDSSSGSSEEAPELSAEPAAGEVVTSDGYSYSVPEGWVKQDAAIAPGADTVALDESSTGTFANNVNVVLSPSGSFTPDDVEAAAGDELEAGGATNVEVLDRLTVAGGETAHISAEMVSGDVTYKVHQYYLTEDDQTYVVTFSYGDDVSDEEAVDTAESILASWTWS
jgi:hypothetical protein